MPREQRPPLPLAPDTNSNLNRGVMMAAGIGEAMQYLTFRLGDEHFALDISKVREVLDYTTITRVPRTPDFMRGVINLRGSVVPVVDLRLKFGMTATERGVNTCIVICEVHADTEVVAVGALADAVEEVLDLEPGSVAPPPRIGTKLRTDFIRGMGRRNDRLLIILDIDKVFSAGELTAVQPDVPADEMRQGAHRDIAGA